MALQQDAATLVLLNDGRGNFDMRPLRHYAYNNNARNDYIKAIHDFKRPLLKTQCS